MQSSPFRIMPMLILIYAGITLMVFPYFVYLGDIWRELLPSLGLALLITGFIKLLASDLDKKFDKVIEIFSGPLSKEVQEFKLLYSEDIIDKIRRVYCLDEKKVIINIKVVGRWTDELIESLSLNSKEGIKILICGYTDYIKENIEEYPEIELFLRKLKKNKSDKVKVEIRTTSESSPNTVFIFKPFCSIVVPFDANSKKMFYIQSNGNSEYLNTYNEMFDSLWSLAIEHND